MRYYVIVVFGVSIWIRVPCFRRILLHIGVSPPWLSPSSLSLLQLIVFMSLIALALLLFRIGGGFVTFPFSSGLPCIRSGQPCNIHPTGVILVDDLTRFRCLWSSAILLTSYPPLASTPCCTNGFYGLSFHSLLHLLATSSLEA